MEYTESKGTVYIGGIMRVKNTPKGWTIFQRKTMQGNDYEPMIGEHFDTKELALEEAEKLWQAEVMCK